MNNSPAANSCYDPEMMNKYTLAGLGKPLASRPKAFVDLSASGLVLRVKIYVHNR